MLGLLELVCFGIIQTEHLWGQILVPHGGVHQVPIEFLVLLQSRRGISVNNFAGRVSDCYEKVSVEYDGCSDRDLEAAGSKPGKSHEERD